MMMHMPWVVGALMAFLVVAVLVTLVSVRFLAGRQGRPRTPR